MKLIINSLKQLRIHHWSKNLLLFVPLFFGGAALEQEHLVQIVLSFLAFSLLASCMYIFNDYWDLAEDRKHPTKKLRPLAKGELSLTWVILLFAICALLSIILILWLDNLIFGVILVTYILCNLTYNLITKALPIWDMFTIAGMYILRLFAGSAIVGINLSGWVFVTVFFGALVLLTGKRYSELKLHQTRKVLSLYSLDYLKNLLLINQGVTVAAFTVYSITQGTHYLPGVIIFAFIIFRYYYLVEMTDKGEQPEVMLFKDIELVFLILLFIIFNFINIYTNTFN